MGNLLTVDGSVVKRGVLVWPHALAFNAELVDHAFAGRLEPSGQSALKHHISWSDDELPAGDDAFNRFGLRRPDRRANGGACAWIYGARGSAAASDDAPALSEPSIQRQ